MGFGGGGGGGVTGCHRHGFKIFYSKWCEGGVNIKSTCTRGGGESSKAYESVQGGGRRGIKFAIFERTYFLNGH